MACGGWSIKAGLSGPAIGTERLGAGIAVDWPA
jgi:hypothetical protein